MKLDCGPESLINNCNKIEALGQVCHTFSFNISVLWVITQYLSLFPLYRLIYTNKIKQDLNIIVELFFSAMMLPDGQLLTNSIIGIL